MFFIIFGVINAPNLPLISLGTIHIRSVSPVNKGRRYVHLGNVDGEHDYHYSPDDAMAYRVNTEGDRDESGYIAKKAWHFDYEEAYVIGEDIVNGKECYLLRKGKNTFAFGKSMVCNWTSGCPRV
jgi:hypothetical protein